MGRIIYKQDVEIIRVVELDRKGTYLERMIQDIKEVALKLKPTI